MNYAQRGERAIVGLGTMHAMPMSSAVELRSDPEDRTGMSVLLTFYYAEGIRVDHRMDAEQYEDFKARVNELGKQPPVSMVDRALAIVSRIGIPKSGKKRKIESDKDGPIPVRRRMI